MACDCLKMAVLYCVPFVFDYIFSAPLKVCTHAGIKAPPALPHPLD